MKNCKEILLLVCITFSVELVEAKMTSNLVAQTLKSIVSLVASAKAATIKRYAQVKDLTIAQTKNLQDKFKVNTTQNSTTTERAFHGQSAMPAVAQASKTEAEQAATASGLLNFAKNSTTTSNNNTYNYNYAKKTWHETFSDWVKNGGQTRAAGTGLAVGAVGGYSLHAAVTPKEKEKIIVIQAQPEKN